MTRNEFIRRWGNIAARHRFEHDLDALLETERLLLSQRAEVFRLPGEPLAEWLKYRTGKENRDGSAQSQEASALR